VVSPSALTQKLWNYCNVLRDDGLSYERTDLDDFVARYNPKNRHDRQESDQFRGFGYDDLAKRDKLNLDIFWLKDESLEESANLPDPDVIAAEIAEDLEAALEKFSAIAEDLKT
jgi:type I restriction enzyme M protein